MAYFNTRGMVHEFVHGWGPIGWAGGGEGRASGGWLAVTAPWSNSWSNSWLKWLSCKLYFYYIGEHLCLEYTLISPFFCHSFLFLFIFLEVFELFESQFRTFIFGFGKILAITFSNVEIVKFLGVFFFFPLQILLNIYWVFLTFLHWL